MHAFNENLFRLSWYTVSVTIANIFLSPRANKKHWWKWVDSHLLDVTRTAFPEWFPGGENRKDSSWRQKIIFRIDDKHYNWPIKENEKIPVTILFPKIHPQKIEKWIDTLKKFPELKSKKLHFELLDAGPPVKRTLENLLQENPLPTDTDEIVLDFRFPLFYERREGKKGPTIIVTEERFIEMFFLRIEELFEISPNPAERKEMILRIRRVKMEFGLVQGF